MTDSETKLVVMSVNNLIDRIRRREVSMVKIMHFVQNQTRVQKEGEQVVFEDSSLKTVFDQLYEAMFSLHAARGGKSSLRWEDIEPFFDRMAIHALEKGIESCSLFNHI